MVLPKGGTHGGTAKGDGIKIIQHGCAELRCGKLHNSGTCVFGSVSDSICHGLGVAGVVNLEKGIVTVSYAQDVPEEQIKTRIERHGYTVTELL